MELLTCAPNFMHLGHAALDTDSQVGPAWSLLIFTGGPLPWELMNMTKGFAEHAWTHPLEWEINVLSMVTGLSLGQASLGTSLRLMGPEFHISSICMQVRGAEKRVLNMYVCVHPCCQCIIPCSPTQGVMLRPGRIPVRGHQGLSRTLFLAYSWLSWSNGFSVYTCCCIQSFL